MQQRRFTVASGVFFWKKNISGERKEIKDHCCGNAGVICWKVREACYRAPVGKN